MAPAMPFSWHHLNQWNISGVAVAILVAAGVIYALGVRRASPWPYLRSVSFAAGLLVTFFATQSVIGVYDMELFSDHMIEHLLLIMVAAPLFALSSPLDLARAAGGRRTAAALDSPVAKVVLHPLFGFGLYAVFIPATHLTSFFNLMIEHEWIHHSEQVAFLVVGYLFFRPAFGIDGGRQIHPGLRLVYVMGGVPIDTWTGLTLNQSTINPYSAYNMMGMGTKSSVLANIHLGGAIMWIGGDALMLVALIPTVVVWLKYESVRTRELDAQLDAAGI
jgi:putative membrane protein